MRSRALLLACLLALTVLAGCAGPGTSDDPVDAATSSSASSPSTSAGSGPTTAPASSTPSSSSSSAPQNHAPAISALSATRPDAAALAFSFAFDGSDPDRDPVSWALDANGDGTKDAEGTALPGSASFTYASAGRYNATLILSDGKLQASQSIGVNATLAAAPVTIHSEWKVGTAWCVGYPYNPLSGLGPVGATPYKHGTPAADNLYGEEAVDAALAGRAFRVDFGAPFKPGGAASADAALVAFYAADDSFLAVFGSEGGVNSFPPSAPADPMVVEGTIPAGAAWVTLFNCANPAGLAVDLVVS